MATVRAAAVLGRAGPAPASTATVRAVQMLGQAGPAPAQATGRATQVFGRAGVAPALARARATQTFGRAGVSSTGTVRAAQAFGRAGAAATPGTATARVTQTFGRTGAAPKPKPAYRYLPGDGTWRDMLLAEIAAGSWDYGQASETPATPPATPAATGRIARTGTTLAKDGQPWRGAGVNYPGIAFRESTLAYPTHAAVDSVLDECVTLGANLIRGHTLAMSAGLPTSLVTGINADGSLVWNTAAWEPIDYPIAGMRTRSLKAWIVTTDQHNYFHLGKGWWIKQAFLRQGTSGIPSAYTYDAEFKSGSTWLADPAATGTSTINQTTGVITETGVTTYNYTVGQGFQGTKRNKKISQQFYTLPWLQDAFIAYTVAWLNHVNQYTGIANKDEPAVAFIQMGNEFWDSGDQYGDHGGPAAIAGVKKWSAAVKAAAPSILVIDPMGSDGVNNDYAPGRDDPNTDLLDYHAYNSTQTIPAGYISGIAAKANALGKGQMFGEYPFLNGGISTALSEMQTTGNVAAGLFWAIYPAGENHSGGGDDTVYQVGTTYPWKSTFQSHSAVMGSGTVPPPPAPPTNILRSASVANNEAPVSAYGSGATSDTPAALVVTTGGINGNALRATISGPTHQWVYVDQQAAAAPVTPGQTYTMGAHVKLTSGTPATGAAGHITWRLTDGSYLSGSTQAGYTALSSGWTLVTYTATAPATAAWAVPQIELDGPATGTAVLFIDQWGLYAGTSGSPWSAPA